MTVPSFRPTTPAALHDHVHGLLSAADALLSTAPARALDLAREALDVSTLDAPLEAQGRRCAGQALHRLAQFNDAQVELTRAADLYRAAADAPGEADALVTLAKVTRELGNLTSTQDTLARALHLSRFAHDRRLEAEVLNQQAVLLQMTGHSDRALSRFQEALTLREAQGDMVGSAQVLSNIGQVHLSQAQHGEALAALNRASQLLGTRDEPLLWAQCLMSTGHVYEDTEDWPQAYDAHRRALDLGQLGGNRLIELYALNNVAGAAQQLGRHGEALDLCRRSLQLAEEVGQQYLAGGAHHGLGQALTALGRWDEALAHHHEALRIATELGDPGSEVDARLGLGEAHLRRGEVIHAAGLLTQTLGLAEQAGMTRAEAHLHGLLAETFERTGDLPVALTHLRRQRELELELAALARNRQTRQLTVQFDVERTRHEAEIARLRTETARRAYAHAEEQVERRTRDLARTQVEVLTRLANAAEFRDDITGEHTLRVGQVSALLAAQLGQPPEDVALIRLAARLHDVGKIGISDLILLKPDRLTPAEFERMKDHAAIGGQILAGGDSRLLQLARDIALHHHEQWSGGGYPAGLSGTDIPLPARIVAVADVYDALAHTRPYKRRWSTDEVLAELRRQSGRQFDPDVIQALDALHASGQMPLQAVLDTGHDAQDVLVQLGLERGRAPEGPPPVQDGALLEQLRRLETRYELARTEISGLQVAAFTDALTGLANRRAFEADLESELAQAERRRRRLTIASLDVDGLKALNDSEGHERGDALLQAVAGALQATLAPFGRLYRLGGDEFALIAPWDGNACLDDLNAQLQAGLADVRRRGFPQAQASVGIATFPDDARTPGDVMRLSDQRMYAQKFAQRPTEPRADLH